MLLMSKAKSNKKFNSGYLGVVLSALYLVGCNNGSSGVSSQPVMSGSKSIVNKNTLASPTYSTAEVGKMIPLKLLNTYDNFFMSIGGAAVNGYNPDTTVDVFVDSGSTVLVIPEAYVKASNVKVLESCVNDYWGNVDDLVQGQISAKSADGATNYTVESYIFYRVRNIANKCTNNVTGKYFDGTLHQRQLIMGIGTGLLNPTYNSKRYCVGGFFNFLDYSSYSQANFSIVSFGNALESMPSSEKLIPFSMQSYISVGVTDKGSNFNYTPMKTNNAFPTFPCSDKVQSSWSYWNRAPISIKVESFQLQLPIYSNATPTTGSESSIIPYAAVDTGGGSLGMVDLPGNPNINALNNLNVLEIPSNGCYKFKQGASIRVQLGNINSNTINTSYNYKVLPAVWGAYQPAICISGTNMSFNSGFPLFYAANTVTFDFTNQRIGVSLGQITPPSPIPLPNFFCSVWRSKYNIVSYHSWGSAPRDIQAQWASYYCNERLLTPEMYLFH